MHKLIQLTTLSQGDKVAPLTNFIPGGTVKEKLTTKQAARALGVSPASLLKFVQGGRLRAFNIGAGTKAVLRFDLADVEAFKKSITINPDKGAA
jgi:excisionase family DNA binding protein